MEHQRMDGIKGDPGPLEKVRSSADADRLDGQKREPELPPDVFQHMGPDRGEAVVKRDFGQAYFAASDASRDRDVDNEALKAQQAARAVGADPQFHTGKTPGDVIHRAEQQTVDRERGKSA